MLSKKMSLQRWDLHDKWEPDHRPGSQTTIHVAHAGYPADESAFPVSSVFHLFQRPVIGTEGAYPFLGSALRHPCSLRCLQIILAVKVIGQGGKEQLTLAVLATMEEREPSFAVNSS